MRFKVCISPDEITTSKLAPHDTWQISLAVSGSSPAVVLVEQIVPVQQALIVVELANILQGARGAAYVQETAWQLCEGRLTNLPYDGLLLSAPKLPAWQRYIGMAPGAKVELCQRP